jgi:hypothetical protein
MTSRATQPIVFRWDLDKTYLATDFDSFGDLVRTFRQTPQEKTNIPGADALLRELLHQQHRDGRRVTFISGSPQQMRRKLEEKLRLDGIEPDLFVLKPNLQNLLRGRLRALRGQIGYKLFTLLKIRQETPEHHEFLFGDDAEQDAFIYSLYADIVSGRVGRALVQGLLAQARVYPDTAAQILEMIRHIPVEDSVQRIFINLERHTPTARFLPYGGRLVPIHNYFQAALVLFEAQVLNPEAILRVALSMVRHHRYSPFMLANSFQDLVRRRRISAQTATEMAAALESATFPEDIPSDLNPSRFLEDFTERLRAVEGSPGAALLGDVGVPDYRALLKEHHP